MIKLHDAITVAEVKLITETIGARLVYAGDGNFVLTPQRVTDARAAKKAANIVKFPRPRSHPAAKPAPSDPPGPRIA